MAAARFSPLVLALCLWLAPTSARAITVIVPDQYPTIQAAINSGADVVQVKAGDYDERLDLYHHSVVTLEAYRTSYDSYSAGAFPRVRGIVDMPSMLVRGIHFVGTVRAAGWNVQFDECRFDSSLTTLSSLSFLRLHGCQIFGGYSGHAIGGFEIDGCTVIGGGLNVSTEGWGFIRGCYVSGPAPIGIAVASWDASLSIEHNTVERATDGIQVMPKSYTAMVVDNEVRDCSGTAYRVTDTGGGLSTAATVLLQGNRAKRCQGPGIDVTGTFRAVTAAWNTVDSVGSDGIRVECAWVVSSGVLTLTGNRVDHSSGCGIWIQRKTSALPQIQIQSNVVLNSSGDGVRTELGGSVIGNVVGRSGGHGLAASTTALGKVRTNTFYLSNGSGILMPAVASDSVDHNIAYGSRRYGLESGGQPIQAVRCNDWYLNLLGAVGGTAPGPTDLMVDPRFCSLPQDSVWLSADSPLANAPGCGQIGALGIGCAAPTTAVDPGRDPRDVDALTATPIPSRGSVRLRWRPLEHAARLEIYDAGGARRWEGRIEPGRGELEWESRTTEGAPLPAGIYFARLAGERSNEATRIVLVR